MTKYDLLLIMEDKNSKFRKENVITQSMSPYGYCVGPAQSNPLEPRRHCTVGLRRFQAVLHTDALRG